MSDKGALGRRIPPSREPSGGDCEERSSGREKLVTAGELKDEVGAEPEEYTDTAESKSQYHITTEELMASNLNHPNRCYCELKKKRKTQKHGETLPGSQPPS
jgi:hypothetical protein